MNRPKVAEYGLGPQDTGRLSRWAWLPIPLFLAAIAVLWGTDQRTSYESVDLAIAMNLVFSVLASIVVAYLIGRGFLASGAPGLLMLGCGVVVWGLAGLMGLIGNELGAPPTTIHNSCVLLSAACQLAGAVLLLRPRPAIRVPGLWLSAAYAISPGVVLLVTLAALAGWMPPFFIQGHGGTPLRQVVLGSSVVMLIFTADLLRTTRRVSPSQFTHWYALALGLIATGLLGVMIQSSSGSLLGWTGRAAQFLSGVYFVIAAVASVRESGSWQISMEDALRESEDRFHQLFETMQEAVILYEVVTDDQDSPVDPCYLEANHSAQQMLGLSRKQLIGHTVKELFPETDSGLIAAAMKVALTGEAAFLGQYLSVTGNWLESRIYSPHPRQVALVSQDITERKHAEEALRRNEQHLKEVLSSIQDGFFELDREWRFTYINRRAANNGGFEPEELIARTIWDTFPYMVGSRFEAVYRDVMETRKPAQFDIESSTRDQWYEVSVYPSVAGISGYWRDITERKQAEESLRESRDRFQVLTRNLDSGVALVDEVGRFSIVNPAFLRMFDLPDESDITNVNDRDWEAWQVFDEREVLLDVDEHPVRKSAMTGKSVQNKLVGVRSPASKALRWMLVSAEPIIKPDGRIGALICTYHDITERKQAEQALAAAKDLLEHQVCLLQRVLIPAKPQIVQGYSVGSAYIPAYDGMEIGGDFLDVFRTESGKVGILIGDVSGKGIGSAALAATTRSTVRAFAYDTSSSGEAMTHANSLLAAHQNDTMQFVTSFLAILDPATGDITYCSAGHPPAVVSGENGGTKLIGAPNMPLGVLGGTEYKEGRCNLRSGERLVLYTDGITEARHESGLFGTEGLERVLASHGQASPDELVGKVLDAVRDWAHGKLRDDTAVLIVRRER